MVCGAADQFQKLRYGKRLADDLGCQLITIKGGKHFVPEDPPDIVASAVSAVVAESASAGPAG